MTKTAVASKTSIKKREGIIKAALAVFLESGYGATTIDAIVQRAGGSKATIYKHFKNKEELFEVVVDSVVQLHPVGMLDPDDPPQIALQKYAQTRLQVLFARQHSSLRRLLIGEGARFPHIARMYFAHGPGLSHTILADYFLQQKKRGNLSIKDPQTAADSFQSMLLHPLYLRTLYAVVKHISEAEQKAHATKIVREFIRLYKPD